MNDYMYVNKTLNPILPIPGTVSPNIVSPRGVADDIASGGNNMTAGLSLIQRFGLLAGGVSDLLKAGSIYTQGKYEAAQLKMNARALELNVKALVRDIHDINYVTGIHASNAMKQGAEMKGKQMAAQAESGFSVTETESFEAQLSYTDMLTRDQINQYAYEAAMEVENKRNEIAAVRTQQELMRLESRYISKTSAIAAGLQLVKGAAGIYMSLPSTATVPNTTFQGARTPDGMYGAWEG